MTPTRELAIQVVEKAVKPLSANMADAAAAMHNSTHHHNHHPLIVQLAISQSDKPSQTPHLIVGTPGKIVDWLKRRVIANPSTIKVLVLDEADTMVEQAGGAGNNNSGHRANSLLIRKQLPAACQCLFFSATFTPPVVQFASKLMAGTAAADVDTILVPDGPQFLVREYACVWSL